jgi:hypothetical protein
MPACVISFTDAPDESIPEELQAFSDPVRRKRIFLSSLGDTEKAPLVETILDLYESEVKKIMLNMRNESLKNILSFVGEKKIISALGEERVISALGEKKILAALGDKKIISAILGNKQLLKSLLAKSPAGQSVQELKAGG